jgi:2-oxoglutarate ferredoxin oxidoreductase subunit alpha
MARELIKGNVAVAEAAVRAGLVSYFGYPITPQTELLEYLSARMPELGRAFVQAESELGAINMVYGAACTGRRTMTSSSSPGVSLMQEGLSYIAGTELPAVIVNVVRGGPGLGNIAPSQGDYNQATHGGGHGEYHQLVLAPASVQEAVDLTTLAFDLAEKYRNIGMILMDGSLGQMMEPAELPPFQPLKTEVPDWAVNGESGREKRVLTSINIDPPAQERTNIRLMTRWQEIEANEVRLPRAITSKTRSMWWLVTAPQVGLRSPRCARRARRGSRLGCCAQLAWRLFRSKRLKNLSLRQKLFWL